MELSHPAARWGNMLIMGTECEYCLVVLVHCCGRNQADEYVWVFVLCWQRLRSGSTGVTVLLQGQDLNVAWLGDSQAVLVRQGQAVALMDPHKPDREVRAHAPHKFIHTHRHTPWFPSVTKCLEYHGVLCRRQGRSEFDRFSWEVQGSQPFNKGVTAQKCISFPFRFKSPFPYNTPLAVMEAHIDMGDHRKVMEFVVTAWLECIYTQTATQPFFLNKWLTVWLMVCTGQQPW